MSKRKLKVMPQARTHSIQTKKRGGGESNKDSSLSFGIFQNFLEIFFTLTVDHCDQIFKSCYSVNF